MNFLSKDKNVKKLKLTNPIHFCALGFGSGLIAKAPGTFGTLAAIPVYLLLANLSLVPYLAFILGFIVLGIYFCGKAAKDMQVHDHGAIVWDEIVGFLITMIAIQPSLISIMLGFILFRLFDILKPWPISWLDEKIHGGIGIMLDDILAGVFALASLQLITVFLL